MNEVIEVPSSTGETVVPSGAQPNGRQFDLNAPPEGWTISPVPNIATLTIEYLVSSVAGEVFRTSDKDAIGGHIADIEDAKRKRPEQQSAITQQSIGAFGQAFGQ